MKTNGRMNLDFTCFSRSFPRNLRRTPCIRLPLKIWHRSYPDILCMHAWSGYQFCQSVCLSSTRPFTAAIGIGSLPRTQATWEEGKVAWYPLFAPAQLIPETFDGQVRLCTSYTRLLCGEITKLDMQLAVRLRGNGFIIRDTRGDMTWTTLQPPPVPPSLCL